ncbi:MAG: ABC transporter ATP-binding protein/permease [Clostridiales bacterium]|nr:ABC transporter ATP-binding protein/permease [Clostridiales bacterium]
MLRYLKKYWVYCLLAPLFMLGELTMDLLQPAMMATIVDEGVLGSDMQIIVYEGIRMVLLVIFGGTCGVLCCVFANIAAQSFGNDVRKDMFSHIMDFSFEQTDFFTTGSLVTRITNDVTQVEQMVMMSVRSLVRCVVMFVGGIYMLYRQAPQFAFVAAWGLPFITAIVVFSLKKVSPLYTVIQQKLDRLNCIMQENIAGTRVVKAYVKEEYELEHFSDANHSLCDTNLHAQTILAFLNPSVNIILNLCVVGVLYVGGDMLRTDGSVTPGQIMAAITYLSLILMRIVFMANIFQTFTRASASWKRIREVLDTENAQQSGTRCPDEDRKGEIEFRQVSFAYADAPDRPVLNNLSFSVRRGETLAIIGSTGSGKTSLVQLIPRFYDVTAGAVLVDGQDVREYPLQVLRDKIGIVQQKAELFSRSIQENICWGCEQAEESDVRHAARIAQAEDFIRRMPKSYETPVTEGGHSLSGGQKQRISIARAVIKKPEILIFDDSGSALDLKTEARLYDALHQEFAGTTRIIVAQRIASVRQADRILVLDNGQICACGTHEELQESSAVYREICRSQLRKGAMA